MVYTVNQNFTTEMIKPFLNIVQSLIKQSISGNVRVYPKLATNGSQFGWSDRRERNRVNAVVRCRTFSILFPFYKIVCN